MDRRTSFVLDQAKDSGAHLQCGPRSQALNPHAMKSPLPLASLLVLFLLSLPSESRAQGEKPKIDDVPSEARGFRGMLVGQVVEVKGSTLTVTVQKVGKVLKKSEATQAESLVGKTFEIRGFKDAARDLLRELQAGERVEFGAEAGSGRLEPIVGIHRSEAGTQKPDGGKKAGGKKPGAKAES